MNSENEFLSIAHIAFKDCIDIKQHFGLPILYASVCKVFCVEQIEQESYVICFDDYSAFYNILLLYVNLKNENKRTFIYASKDFKTKESRKFNLIIFRHVSFVDDAGGVYFYEGRIDYLGELFHDLKTETEAGYTKNTQLVFKYYLFNPSKSYTVRTIADYLNISPASVSRANEALFQIGVLTRDGNGAGLEYKIINKNQALKKLRPHFIKPYDKKYFLALNENQYDKVSSYLLSAEDALSYYTDLTAKSKITTYAVSKKDFAPFYNAYLSISIDDASRYAAVEAFIYNPNLFSKGKAIDLFDLYVIMLFDEDLNDPRVLDAFNAIRSQLINE